MKRFRIIGSGIEGYPYRIEYGIEKTVKYLWLFKRTNIIWNELGNCIDSLEKAKLLIKKYIGMSEIEIMPPRKNEVVFSYTDEDLIIDKLKGK